MLYRLLAEWHAFGLARRIRKHGWTAMYVGDYTSAPTWVYTLGFDETLNQPEIVVFDVQQTDANPLLWRAYEELKSGGLVLEDGKTWVEDEQARLVWRKVHPSQIDNAEGWLTFAVERRKRRTGRGSDLEAFQLVLSDAERRMPWDEGYDERLRLRQPALYLPDDAVSDVPLSRFDREALRVARERGWSIMLVDGPTLKWAYTLGLSDVGQPELIAMLPSADGAANILHEAQEHMARGDLILEDGLRWDALGFEACWRRVDESQYLALNLFFLTKLRRERRDGSRDAVEAFQLFLPDNEGHYPWEDGCAKGVRETQPLLFEPFDPAQCKRGPLAALMRI